MRSSLRPTPTLIIDSSAWEEKTIQKFNIQYKCPQGWSCTFNDQPDSIFLTENNSKRIIELYINRLDNTNLNNPNYKSVLKWYDDLNHKFEEATGKGVDKEYGAKYSQGTDGVSLAFYRYYDFDKLTPAIFGHYPGLIIFPAPNMTETDILIPTNNYVYRLSIYPERSLDNPIFFPFLSTFNWGI